MTEFQPIEKICKVSGKKFTVYPEDQEFYAKKGVPLPTLHPLERARRRFAFINNELALYRRKCDATGKDLITFYHPVTPIKVYDREYWLSDEFDPFKYGRDYDPSRSFFAQWRDLYWSVPTFHSAGINNENGDYILYGHGNKNSYLVCGFDTENCMYGMFFGGKDSLDCGMTYGGESLYECLSSKNCYELFFGYFCQDCRESRFMYDCIGCHDCIMCFGLRHKQYCIKNKQLTKEEYEQEKKRYDLGSYEILKKLKAEYEDWLRLYPLRENNNINCDNCVGDFLIDARNCFMCFNGTGSRDTRYGIPYCNMETNCFDTDGTGAVNCYECNCYQSENVMFSKGVLNCSNVEYSIDIMGQSHDLFGCANLKGNNEYCILNKRYSKDDYFKLREQIVVKMKADGEWGEHMPMSMALFPFYDSYSAPAWPIEEKDLLSFDQQKGVARVNLGGEEDVYIHWRPVLDFVSGEASNYQISDNVQDYVSEEKQKELLQAILVCNKTGRKYRIQSRELYFYLKHNIAIPRESFNARHTRRIKQLMRCDVHDAKCDKCGKDILTIYNQEVDKRPVWCGECYETIKD